MDKYPQLYSHIPDVLLIYNHSTIRACVYPHLCLIFTSPFGYPTWKKVCILKYTDSSGEISTWGESKSPVPQNGSSDGMNTWRYMEPNSSPRNCKHFANQLHDTQCHSKLRTGMGILPNQTYSNVKTLFGKFNLEFLNRVSRVRITPGVPFFKAISLDSRYPYSICSVVLLIQCGNNRIID